MFGDGRLRLPYAPCWGVDIDEDAVAEHPWSKG
jgi:L-alanine-DL-glutamate epimerase-like enolase superfamily enzyme